LDCRVLDPGQAGVLIVWLTGAATYAQEREPVSTLLGSLQPAMPVSLPDLDLRAVAAALPGVAGNSYASPSYGYQLTWDPTWSVEVSTSQGGVDVLQLSNGQSRASVAGFVDPTRPPEPCLQAVSTELTTT